MVEHVDLSHYHIRNMSFTVILLFCDFMYVELLLQTGFIVPSDCVLKQKLGDKGVENGRTQRANTTLHTVFLPLFPLLTVPYFDYYEL